MKMGTCATCQQEHQVCYNPSVPVQVEAMLNDGLDEKLYLMVEHHAYGQRCEGSHTIPQFLEGRNPFK